MPEQGAYPSHFWSGLGAAPDSRLGGGLAVRSLGEGAGATQSPSPNTPREVRGGKTVMAGGGLLPSTPTLAIPQSGPCLPGWELMGSRGGCVSAPCKLDLLTAQGSFQAKEKAQPRTPGRSAHSVMNGARVTQ